MAEGGRLPHLQRPVYSNIDSVSQPAPGPARSGQTVSNAGQSYQSSNSSLTAQQSQPVAQKISTESLPRPVQRPDDNSFQYTTSNYNPPSADRQFTVKEEGVSNPRYLRFSINSIPLESSKCTEIGLPVAAVWQPLADLNSEDEQPSVIEGNPFRCSRCMAYVNPFFKFVDGGSKVVCNICGMKLDTPEIYQRDRASRPELYSGTYDFVAPKDYLNRPSQVPTYLFCVDVSAGALALGLVQQVVSSIQAILDYLPVPERTLIGVVTFDSSIQVYKLLNNGELLEILMTDIDDPFIAEPIQGFCFNASTERDALDSFLSKLLAWPFQGGSKQTLSTGTILHALKSSVLKSHGGRAVIFTSQNGAIGKYSLPSRPEFKINLNEKEKAFAPNDLYLTLSQELSSEDICVDIFACGPGTHNNNLGFLCSQTGGDLYYFPNYKAEVDGERVYYMITRILTRTQVSQVVMRARCSNGLSVDYYVGKYKRKGPVEMEIACLDSDKAFTIMMKYDEKLTEGSEHFIQCAMLYSSSSGQSLIRIQNGRISATQSIPQIFKSADTDTINTIFLKSSALQIFEQGLSVVRESWNSNIIKVLVTHRHTLGDADKSKILVPENLKLLPLYCNTSMKLPGLTLANIPFELRCASIHNILGLGVLNARFLAYPRIYALHDLITQEHDPGCISQSGSIILPRLVGCSAEFLKADGVYLINNGDTLMFFIGKAATEEFISQVWGMDSVTTLASNQEYWQLQDLQNEESQRVLAILEEIRKRNPGAYPALYYHFDGQNDEHGFRRLLVEDNNLNEFSYGDFLMKLHKIVISKVSKEN